VEYTIGSIAYYTYAIFKGVGVETKTPGYETFVIHYCKLPVQLFVATCQIHNNVSNKKKHDFVSFSLRNKDQLRTNVFRNGERSILLLHSGFTSLLQHPNIITYECFVPIRINQIDFL